jgi:hypothetical protein
MQFPILEELYFLQVFYQSYFSLYTMSASLIFFLQIYKRGILALSSRAPTIEEISVDTTSTELDSISPSVNILNVVIFSRYTLKKVINVGTVR